EVASGQLYPPSRGHVLEDVAVASQRLRRTPVHRVCSVMVAQDQTLPPWQVAQHSQCVRLPTAGEVTQNPDRVTLPHHFAPVVGDGGVMVNPVIEATEASHLGMTQVQVSGEELPHTDHFPLCRYMSRMSSRFVALIAMRLAISASPALILPFFSSLAMRFM